MSHLKISGAACVVVAFAIGLALPGSSSATVGECVNVGAGNGIYENSTCTIESATQSKDAWTTDLCVDVGFGHGFFLDAMCLMPGLPGTYQEARCTFVAGDRGHYIDTGCTNRTAGSYELHYLIPRALSQNNLQWVVDGKTLMEAGEKYEPTVVAQSPQLLKSTGLVKTTIVCKTAKLLEGAEVSGSANPHPDTLKEKIQYGACEVEGKAECEINGKTGTSKEAKITSETLTGTLVYATKAGAEKEVAEESSASTAGLVLKPATGEVFTAIKLGKGGCPVESTINVTGELLAEWFGKSEIQATTHEMETLESGTYWENNSAKETVSKNVEKMKIPFGTATITGKLAGEIKGSEPWFLSN